METEINRTHQGYRPIATQITEQEWNSLLDRKVTVDGIRFSFSHWQRGELDRIYITAYQGRSKFTGSYIEQYELPGNPQPVTRRTLRAEPMTEKWARAMLEAVSG